MPKKGKDVLAIMLGGGKPKGRSKRKMPEEEEGYEDEYEEDEEEEGEYGQAFEESAAEVFQAVKEGDERTFVASLKDAILTCVEEQGG
jgi:hypothetical protein|tara:strand:+ start:7864 stop:8127 length:264 start_codon:yes stop_codon:yes gene_type:complete